MQYLQSGARLIVSTFSPLDSTESPKIPEPLHILQQLHQRLQHCGKPLFTLTEKDVIFELLSRHQQAFQDLKDVLTHAPVLAYPAPGGGYVLDMDASNVGLGAVLGPIQGGVERVICHLLGKSDPQQC